MIVEQDRAQGAAEWIWDLRPNRSFDARQLRAFFLLMCVVSALVSGFSFSQGNVFAPLFAVAELAVLALCLRLVWRALAARERVHLTAQELAVEARGGQARFHPYWVKLRRDREGRVRLGQHGREIEVGGFLPEQERDQLASGLRSALAALKR